MEHGDGRLTGPREDVLVRTFQALRDRLAGTAYFVLGDREAARDAVQEAFLKCWRRRESVAEASDPEAWVFSVLLNAARDLRRRRRLRRAAPLPDEEVLPVQTREPDPAADAERSEALARVRDALRTLPEEERTVFLLRQNGEMPFPEIARMVRAPVGTVKSRMRLALSRLRSALRPAADAAGSAT